jgi:uncharacterized protein
MELLLAFSLALVVGVALGLLGGGGSILTVPLLVYVLGVEAKSAIATSLLVVGVTASAALILHARAKRVQWRTGLLFGAAGMVGAYLAGRLAEAIPGVVLLVAFGLMMLVTAIAMLRGRSPSLDAETSGPMPIGKVLLEGFAVGGVTGLVGAGGGFLVVPALVLLGGVPMHVAVGTSLVVVALKSFAGFAGYLGHASIDWTLAAVITSAAVIGSLFGAVWASRIPQRALRRGFAIFVLVMGILMLGGEVAALLS